MLQLGRNLSDNFLRQHTDKQVPPCGTQPHLTHSLR